MAGILIPEIKNEFVFARTDSGMRIVCSYSDSAVEYCGVLINVGSRDESAAEAGIAHFIEHTIFKGTKNRRASSIINRMECIGGELNAYTTKEETAVYSIFPEGGLGRAVNLIGDLIVNSIFPLQELDKERDVVLDELESYLDTPSEAVFDDYDEIFFRGNELAHNILGNYDTVRGFTPDMCRDFLRRYYTAGNMVFFYAGKKNVRHVERLVSRGFAGIPVSPAPVSRTEPAVPQQFSVVKKLNTHQSHTVAGAMTPGLFSEEKYRIALLTNILGGPGMNSRLNVALREHRGLVYTVDASATAYTDCGLFSIYFGCDHEDVTKCLSIIRKEVGILADRLLTDRQLDAYKKQYIGQMTVSRENGEQKALSMAKAYLYHSNVLPFRDVALRICDVTPEQLRSAAENLLRSGLSTLTLG